MIFNEQKSVLQVWSLTGVLLVSPIGVTTPPARRAG